MIGTNRALVADYNGEEHIVRLAAPLLETFAGNRVQETRFWSTPGLAMPMR